MRALLKLLCLSIGPFAVAAVIWAGLATGAHADDGSLDRLRKAGYARVGFDQEIPFGYATSDGDLVGSEVNLIREVLKRIGVPDMQGVLTNFDSLIPGLQADRFDIAVSMFIRPKRCDVVLFTQPHETAVDGMVVQKGNPLNIHSMEQFAKNDNLRLGLGAGEITLEWASKLGIPSDRISIFPDQTAAWAGIKAKRVDALILSSLAVGSLFLKEPDAGLERVTGFQNPMIDGARSVNYVGIPFRKQDADLRNAFNTTLQAMIKDKSILKIIGKYGYSEVDLPPANTPPLEEICKP